MGILIGGKKMLKHQVKMWLPFFIVFSLFFGSMQLPVSAAEQTSQGTVTVIGTDPSAPPSMPEKPVAFAPNSTAFDALVNAVGTDHVTFDNSNPTMGKYITGINEVSSVSGGSYWSFYLNGISAPVGVDSYHVRNEDKLTLKYTDYPSTLKSAASLNVIGKDQKVIYTSAYDISFLNKATALNLLSVTLGSDQVGTSDTSLGKMITSIDGVPSQGNDYWSFYVNGKKATVGADSYLLQPGDQIRFQYETVQPSTDSSNGSNNDTVVKPTSTVLSSEQLQQAIDAASKYALANQIGEWEAIALKKAGKQIPSSYLEKTAKLIVDQKGHFARITDTERYILGILAADSDPANVNGYNLVDSVENGNVTKQGLNGVAYALIALDSASFSIPDTAQWSRAMLLNQLLDKQNADGGWAWDGSLVSDSDSTAMVLTALAPYKDQEAAKVKIDAAVHFLSTQYQAGKINNSSTAAQVVIALSALGLDANGSLFAKDDSSLVKFLLSFQNADGGFDWQGGDQSDVFSTSQPFEALVAYQLYLAGKGSLYQLPLAANPKVITVSQQTQEAAPQTGYALPNTATNANNGILLGMGMILMGGLVFTVRLRKKS